MSDWLLIDRGLESTKRRGPTIAASQGKDADARYRSGEGRLRNVPKILG